ncbi:MAG: SDR family NAD(P)-dependent oxidoreductase [Alphaproteobacteria bacterium]
MGERLKDRTILVLGAGSSGPGWGNGKAAAVAFAREGARVAAVDLREEAAAETAGIIRDEGGSAIALAADVTKAADIARVVAATIAELGPIDVLHNNVGITAPGGAIEESEESWRRVIDTNITSVFLACKHVLPGMIARGKGVVTNVSSIASIRWTGYPYFSYYASKAGLNQMTVAMALQHAKDGIRCNAILPGPMDTPLIRQQIVKFYASEEEMLAQRNAACPMGRMGTAWDVAGAAVFLASDEAGYITGVCLPVDGGASARMR